MFLTRQNELSRGKQGPYTAAVIVAGGQGTRMPGADGQPKQLRLLCGKPLVLHTALAFERCARIREIVLVTRAEDADTVRQICVEGGITKLRSVVAGGEHRQQSVLHGFDAISPKARYVAIHDGARCLITPAAIERVLRTAYRYRAATACRKLVDTVKRVGGDGSVTETLNRDELVAAETPQVFEVGLYRAAAYLAETEGALVTDDNMLMERIGQRVMSVPTESENFKVTHEGDLSAAEQVLRKRQEECDMHGGMSIGHGYDVHRLVPERPLLVGGVRIPHPLGLLGHSDGDVLLHAVMDSLLGACGEPDIGAQFPDTDKRYRGADSLELLRAVAGILRSRGRRVRYLDATIVAQAPKMAPHIPQMKEAIAAALGCEVRQINIKATTEEGLGVSGKGEGMAAHAVCLLSSD